ncbi:lysophospholipid acyltransferase family protein [Arthrobacter sp. zg-Y820]|uniref:lysophospholipid acyltransferase family protein n=1 Tax=unclassified Arthrobacter TaxID=235627 RepID=UPI001E5B9D4F|nr:MULTISPECIES: lysophospholipid acyltransferase family protein [unclassified Arthrobacter]MCC9196191.1 1-acyl-sn-glycerol-3-phosphate acyltransferase [Arthrobacter sp. zg-Y820]MDK1279051.1 lysophospholipid acyltransferase family protein [Arthrobacter sp. zg.Y820]WIB08539.1 lysophospholipid acyltransferase family protein [Arthrobacter sp. zg-Y820]
MPESVKSRVAFALLANTMRPVMNLLVRKQWEGLENLPRDTGFIACPNHVTEIDPVVVGHFFYNQKIMPRYLAKASLFKVPVFGSALRATNQVPVERVTSGASASLQAARVVIEAGGALIVYPEGTLTRDPDLWPMRGRTGAARLALQTGAPVVPVAHWGAEALLPRYSKRLNLFPRKTVRLRVGTPVDLSDLRDQPMTKSVLDTATERIMDSLTDLVAELRDEKPPVVRWDPAVNGQRATGRDFEQPRGFDPIRKIKQDNDSGQRREPKHDGDKQNGTENNELA